MNRKMFLVLIVLLTALTSCGNKKSTLPNIVLIVADDLGWKDLGFIGSSYYEGGGTELYNLEADPGERNNLSSVNINKTEELLAKLEVWLETEQGQMQFELNPQFDSLFEKEHLAEIY